MNVYIRKTQKVFKYLIIINLSKTKRENNRSVEKKQKSKTPI
jgi:hypothetical protein